MWCHDHPLTLTLLTLLLIYLLDILTQTSCVLVFNYLFRRRLQCQMEWNMFFQWKIHSTRPSSSRGWSTFGRIWHESLRCSESYSICGCQTPDQKWVLDKNNCALRRADDTDRHSDSASQDCILRRCKVRRGKLFWLGSNRMELK